MSLNVYSKMWEAQNISMRSWFKHSFFVCWLKRKEKVWKSLIECQSKLDRMTHFRPKSFESKSFPSDTPFQPQQGSDGLTKLSEVQMVSCQLLFKTAINHHPSWTKIARNNQHGREKNNNNSETSGKKALRQFQRKSALVINDSNCCFLIPACVPSFDTLLLMLRQINSTLSQD